MSNVEIEKDDGAWRNGLSRFRRLIIACRPPAATEKRLNLTVLDIRGSKPRSSAGTSCRITQQSHCKGGISFCRHRLRKIIRQSGSSPASSEYRRFLAVPAIRYFVADTMIRAYPREVLDLTRRRYRSPRCAVVRYGLAARPRMFRRGCAGNALYYISAAATEVWMTRKVPPGKILAGGQQLDSRWVPSDLAFPVKADI